jgi:hypothetical protein
MLSNDFSDDLKLKLYNASSPEDILNLIFVWACVVIKEQMTTRIIKSKNLVNSLSKELKSIILIEKGENKYYKIFRLQFPLCSIECSIAALTNSLNNGCALVALDFNSG